MQDTLPDNNYIVTVHSSETFETSLYTTETISLVSIHYKDGFTIRWGVWKEWKLKTLLPCSDCYEDSLSLYTTEEEALKEYNEVLSEYYKKYDTKYSF